MNKLPLILKRHAPAILTGASIIFAGGSCVFSAIGGVKLERLKANERPRNKKEEAKLYVRSFWPAAIFFAGSTACSIFSHKMSADKIAGLIAAAVATEERFRSYRSMVREEVGEEKEKDIYAKVVDENWNCMPDFPHKVEDYDDHSVFYDEYSERYFVSSVEKVQQAIYHLNRTLTKRGWVILNEFYEMLDIGDIPKGDEQGWSDCDFLDNYGMAPWIDIYSTVKENEDGTKYFVLSYDIEPTVLAIEKVYGPS